MKTKTGVGEITKSYDENSEHPDEYGVKYYGKYPTYWYNVNEFEVPNPNHDRWVELNNLLDTLYRAHKNDYINQPPAKPEPEMSKPVEKGRRLLPTAARDFWTDYRHYYVYADGSTVPWPTSDFAGKFIKTDKNRIPDFEDKILLYDREMGWEFLGVFVDELLEILHIRPQDRITVEIDEDGKTQDVSYNGIFSRYRTGKDDPSIPWASIGDEKFTMVKFGREHPIVVAWWWVYTFFKENVSVGRKALGEAHFVRILTTIGGSRNDRDWVNPQFVEKTDENFELLLQRARNLNGALEFMEQKGFMHSDIDLSTTYTFQRMNREFQDIVGIVQRKFQRELRFNTVDIPVLEGRKLDLEREYRSDFRFDGSEIVWELFEELPRPTDLLDYANVGTMETFFRENWLPVFENWPYDTQLHPERFLIGKSAWKEPLIGVKANLRGHTESFLFMTMDNLVTENVTLMGLNPRNRRRIVFPRNDARPLTFVQAFYNVFVRDRAYQQKVRDEAEEDLIDEYILTTYEDVKVYDISHRFQPVDVEHSFRGFEVKVKDESSLMPLLLLTVFGGVLIYNFNS